MQSQDNPLYTTKEYYGETNSASRGNVTSSHMFNNPLVQRPGGGGGTLFNSQSQGSS